MKVTTRRGSLPSCDLYFVAPPLLVVYAQVVAAPTNDELINDDGVGTSRLQKYLIFYSWFQSNNRS